MAPDGRLLPGTYWPSRRLTLEDFERLGEGIAETPEFVAARLTLAACVGCPGRGGCAGRRAVLGTLQEADPYCPFARRGRVVMDWEPPAGADLPKLGRACTIVVSAL